MLPRMNIDPRPTSPALTTMRFGCIAKVLIAVLLVVTSSTAPAQDALRIGSKRFTESYILAQVLVQSAQPHAAVEVQQGLGNTAIVYTALRNGNIDAYPEYTGTIAQEILKSPGTLSLEAMREHAINTSGPMRRSCVANCSTTRKTSPSCSASIMRTFSKNTPTARSRVCS